MAAALVLRPAHHDRMQVHSFKGDQAHLLDKLIAASARKEAPPESLKERALVPFFDSSDASASTFQSLQPSGRRQASKPLTVPRATAGASAHHGLKRHAHERSSTQLAGSPPKKEAEVVQATHQRRKPASPATSSGGRGAATGAGAASDAEATSGRKPQRASGKKHQRPAVPAQPASGQRTSPPRKRAERAAPDAARAAAAAALRTPGKPASKPAKPALPSKFAGPAFTNSPLPENLPIPTSSLLLQEAAESLRSRLTL